MFVFGFFLVVLAITGRSFDLDSSDFSHVVVIPDIHGDRDALLRSLWLAVKEVDSDRSDVVDFNAMVRAFTNFVETNEYTGPQFAVRKDVVLVQLGDVLDRGPHGVEIFSILAGIPDVIGWKYVQLYGNHELMNFVHASAPYLHPNEIGLLGLSDIEERKSLFSNGGILHTYITQVSTGILRLMAPGTASSLFVHGGVDLGWIDSELGINDGNVTAINAQISDFAKSKAVTSLNAGTSVFWTRSLAQLSESIACPLVEKILRRFNVHRVVVGHTPQEDMEAKTRCDGKIVLTDVMMSRWMVNKDVDETSNKGGRPVAVILKIHQEGGDLESLVAHYTDLSGTLKEADDLSPTSLLDYDDDEDDDDEFGDLDLLLSDPVLEDLLVVHPKHQRAVYTSTFLGKRGYLHVSLRSDAKVDEKLNHKIANALRVDAPVVDVMLEAPRDLAGAGAVSYFFVRAPCDRFVSLKSAAASALRKIGCEISKISSRLLGEKLILGLTEEDEILSAFAVCEDNHKVVFLADWSAIRHTEDPTELSLHQQKIDNAIAKLFS
jgi:hypothetical protein